MLMNAVCAMLRGKPRASVVRTVAADTLANIAEITCEGSTQVPFLDLATAAVGATVAILDGTARS